MWKVFRLTSVLDPWLTLDNIHKMCKDGKTFVHVHFKSILFSDMIYFLKYFDGYFKMAVSLKWPVFHT